MLSWIFDYFCYILGELAICTGLDGEPFVCEHGPFTSGVFPEREERKIVRKDNERKKRRMVREEYHLLPMRRCNLCSIPSKTSTSRKKYSWSVLRSST
jgi:hypothetical protein